MHTKELIKAKIDLAALPCVENIRCVLLYGSVLQGGESQISDTDIIIVVNDIRDRVESLFRYIFSHFPNPDFHIYDIEELDKGTAFYTREYVLEYLSKATSLYGANPFVEMYRRVTKEQYRNSILIRSIEHVQKVRKVVYTDTYSQEQKLSFLKKYTRRLMINLLLYKSIASYDELNVVSFDELLELFVRAGMLQPDDAQLYEPKIELDKGFLLFCKISENLTNCMSHQSM